ncbi:MAG: hypothetical protein OEL77_02975 [Nitrosopumilus sp.]|nr:hypothetical protein [Nitrosopumilus sp.]MDH3384958.1 hypothetical protein [Nitrosopumilus sp.]
MEKLPKFAIYLAIGIGITIFALILYSILPHIIENSARDWDRALGNNLTEEELKAMFYADPSYTAFKEKYPDATESFESWNRGEGRLQMVMYNYTNFNEIRLDIDYDNYRSKVNVNVNCQITNPFSDRDVHRGVQGSGAVDFIEKVNCLDSSGIISYPQTTDCGPGTQDSGDGVCTVIPRDGD